MKTQNKVDLIVQQERNSGCLWFLAVIGHRFMVQKQLRTRIKDIRSKNKVIETDEDCGIPDSMSLPPKYNINNYILFYVI